MPWLTPDSIPEDDDCRPLFIPADSVWLALVSGALTELTLPYNWQQFGSLTVQETVDKMQEIVDGYYDTACLNCTFPGGGKVIRIDITGHVQQLDDNGEWVDPTGDYVIPPPDARTGGTEDDQICLAAKNAVNVLHTLYMSLSDSFADNLSEAEAATAFIGALVAAVGFEFAPITFGIVIFAEAVFQLLYQALAYLTADLWDDKVDKQIRCFLIECATNAAGVVTFDWDCFIAKLNSLTDNFLLSETQLRLYLQITYILYFIGGIDGLNLAAGTTAITDDDCSGCEGWCYEFDLTSVDGGFTANVGVHTGAGWIEDYVNGAGCASNATYTYVNLYRTLPAGVYTSIDIQYNLEKGSICEANTNAIWNTTSGGSPIVSSSANSTPDGIGSHFVWTGASTDPAALRFQIVCGENTPFDTPSGHIAITKVTYRGTGDDPFGTDNCG